MQIVYDKNNYIHLEVMMKRQYLAVLLCFMGIFLFQINTEAKSKPWVSADSAIVMDVQSGTILYEKNIDKKEYPASITKVMTAFLAIENSSLSETVTYSREAVTNLESGASNVGIQPGEKMSMEDSLYAILLMSANEACNGVAEHVAGSIDNFVKMMNKRAKELGCTNTHFANTNGLWMKNHYTSAHDMALISQAAYKNPTFAKITGTKRYITKKTNKSGNRYLHNHHGMLYPSTFSQYLYEYCVGGKTGYTSKCRYTLVTYAKKNNMTLVSVIMRAPKSPWEKPNEYTDTTDILNYCFENYKRFNITKNANTSVNESNLFTNFSPYFSSEISPLSVEKNAGVVLPKGVSLKKTEKRIEMYDQPKEISKKKKNIGKITYTYNGKEVGGSEIYYEDKGTPVLQDSIDMEEWFEDAMEKAKEEPFSWMKTIIIGAVAIVVIGGIVFIVWWLRKEKDHRERKKHYRRTRRKQRSNERGLYYRKRR